MKSVPGLLLGLVSCLALNVSGATLSLSRNSITNTFTGGVTVTIGGLTNGEPVVLRKFIDFNGNGQVDAGEVPAAWFELTDGQVMSIGGRRNENVPGDEDGLADGTIRETFEFADTGDREHFLGAYVVEASSPSGRFTPVSQAFTVTPTAFAQGVTGRVTNGANAFVVLLQSSGDDQEIVAGTIADAAGDFSLPHREGQFLVLPVRPGHVTSFTSAVPVQLTAGSTTNVNFNLLAATRTLGGRVTDAGSGAGLPAVELFAQSTNDLITLARTDGAGNFSIPVTDGLWRLEVSVADATRLGYLAPEGDHDQSPAFLTSTGNVANVSVQLPRANALIYGDVRDPQNGEIDGLKLGAESGGYRTETISQSTGEYYLAVLGGSAQVSADTAAMLQRGVLLTGTNVTVATNQQVNVNLTVRTITATVSGRVVDGNGNPVQRMGVVLQPAPVGGNGASSFYPSTDDDGRFTFGLYGGDWNIALECVAARERNLVSPTLDFTLTDGVNRSDLNFTAPVATAQITGFIRDDQSAGVSGLRLFANATINGTNYVVGCTSSQGDGSFSLQAINGTWTVGIQDDLPSRGFQSAANQPATVSGANGTANFTLTPANSSPMLSQASMSGPGFRFHLNGLFNRQFRIEGSADLAGSANWSRLSTNTTDGGGLLIYTDPASTSLTQRFYRAVLLP